MKTLRVKVRSGMSWLDKAATEVNAVWNWANETSYKAATRTDTKRKWLSGFDLDKLAAGATHEFLHVGSVTIKEVCKQYAVKRRKARRTLLRWRASAGAKRSLGWVPFKRGSARVKDGAIMFCGHRFRVFDSYGLDKYDLRAGSFAQNAIGEWFFNVAVHVPVEQGEMPASAVGIDLGLKTVATSSEGTTLSAGQFYRSIEQKIAQAQRRGHKRQAKRLHLKAANRRKDAIHKFTTAIVRKHGAIYVGDVSSTRLAKTRMAKAVLDAGWRTLKTQLQYKGHWAGRVVEVVSERNTTRVCSNCGQHTGPRGLRQLAVRSWDCVACETTHDRDCNAAVNILRIGLGTKPPLAGTPQTIRRAPISPFRVTTST